jgi:predicted metal-dependent hydrolase
VPVQITKEHRPATIQVMWPNGLSVQVPTECDPAEVQAVLQVVDALAWQR